MTSWISRPLPRKKIAPEPAPIFSLNQGTFTAKTSKPTLVTAFYDIPDTVSLAIRKQRLQSFLQTSQSQIVVFTESQFAEELASFRKGKEKKTQVVVLQKSEWVALTRYIPSLWTQQAKQDPEIRMNRTLEQYQFGYEKKEFLLKAITMNPFKSIDFVWIEPWQFETLPSSEFSSQNIPTDKILVANPEAFTADDLASSYFRGKTRVDNRILAASSEQWKEYAKLYDIVMNLKLKVFSFVGDDSLMLHYSVIHKPNQFCLVKQDSLLSVLTP
jgi:hypothetical protein